MQCLQYRIEEVHKLVNGTLNCFDHFALSQLLPQLMKYLLLIKALETEIDDLEEHESIGLW